MKRRPVRSAQSSQTTILPAPIRGWIENENHIVNGGNGAAVLENWFPEERTVRVRGGSLLHGDAGAPVNALIRYKSGTAEKLFATTATKIVDMTNGAGPVDVVTGITTGIWSSVQMDTGGGQFLVMVNGVDDGRYFDGTDWHAYGAVGDLDITGVNSDNLSHVWAHASRLWFVKANSLTAWYLDVDAIAGAASDFTLGSVFQKGGALLFGGSLSQDTGDGLDDRCVFVSTEGEVAIFQGTFPGSDSWALVGRYDISRPVSPHTLKAGGDIIVATEAGLIPLSAVVVKDPGVLSLSAISYAIEPSWRRLMDTRLLEAPVQMIKIPARQMGVVCYPQARECHVINLRTGAWAKWTKVRAQAMVEYRGRGYWANKTGKIFMFEGAGSDNGDMYVARMSMLPNDLRAGERYKSVTMARATFRSNIDFLPKISAQVNFSTEFPTRPDAVIDEAEGESALWDVGEWDTALWDVSIDAREKKTCATAWQSIGRSGFSISPQVQISSGGARIPDVEFVSVTILHGDGAVVV